MEEPVVTGEDGAFEFPSVREGDWTLRAESDTVRDVVNQRDTMPRGAASLSVGRRDLDDLQIRVLAPFELTGSVELSNTIPAPVGLFVTASLCSENGFHAEQGRAEKDRTLQIQNVTPGAYRIRPEVLGGNYYPASVLLGNRDVTDQTVNLTPASPAFRIVLKPAGSVRGTVENGEGATVVLFPQSFTGIGQSVICGTGGNFEFTGLAPGEYFAAAVDHFNLRPGPNLGPDATRLRALAAVATNVRVESGAVASLQLRLTANK